ncbi:FRG domain-containing protein [Shewanella sp. 5_MG-2023]|uniref:FRG domain-containing protein n=1 Tax=Shewanella sp. 5_MG-2023 TaxID=3062656 RepID=UPI0026E1EBCB|nr:FRG domain-containing protein [Shewanella sp. 5_MG-2023]MDO6642140.1 FRG domain-containing protein [Shewanella sp. 5_MG-2023]
MTKVIIDKLSEYMAFIEDLPTEFTLSRGQCGDYPLLPSALRKDSSDKRKYPKRAIRSFLDEFKLNSYQYMDNPSDIENDIEWMLYAQHYGIPTRLMDFTTSHIVSLLFAVEKSFQNEEEKEAVVYFLNPTKLNLLNIQQEQIINISGLPGISSEGHDGPIVIQGRKINPRVNAQKGLFVLFQDDDNPLESINDENVLRKLVITGSETKNILSSLYSMGISFSHIYPELSSVAKDIVMQQDILDYIREKN